MHLRRSNHSHITKFIWDVDKTFSTTDATTMTASTDCRVLQQLLQKETELYEKTRKEHQLEKEKLLAILDTLVKAKLKKRDDDDNIPVPITEAVYKTTEAAATASNIDTDTSTPPRPLKRSQSSNWKAGGIDQKEKIREMEIDDDQKEEKWRNPETFTFEKHMKDFNQIKPKPDNEEDTEAMIVESDPIKRAEALLEKAFHIVKFSSPTNNQVYFEADGETEKTQEFWDKISDGAMCCLFPADNWHYSIDVDKYHSHGNILGGICKHGLVPLQSIKKTGKKAVWMAPMCNLAWMAGHVGAHKSKPLFKSKNQVVAVFLFPGDPQLKYFRPFWAPGAYVRAIHPARAFERIPVDSSDTIEFDLDAIPYQFKHLPQHYDMVELMTPEQNHEASRKYHERMKQEELEASFSKFRQKKMFRKALQCGCGEQYDRFTEYQKHINQYKHRHFGIRKAKDVSLETPGVSALSRLQDRLRYNEFKSLFGHLSLTSPVRQSADRLLRDWTDWKKNWFYLTQ